MVTLLCLCLWLCFVGETSRESPLLVLRLDMAPIGTALPLVHSLRYVGPHREIISPEGKGAVHCAK